MNEQDKITIGAYLIGMRAMIKACGSYEVAEGVALFRMSFEGCREFIDDLSEQGIIKGDGMWYRSFQDKINCLQLALYDFEGNFNQTINPFPTILFEEPTQQNIRQVLKYIKENTRDPLFGKLRTYEDVEALFRAAQKYETQVAIQNKPKYSVEPNPFKAPEFEMLKKYFEDYHAFCKELVEKT